MNELEELCKERQSQVKQERINKKMYYMKMEKLFPKEMPYLIDKYGMSICWGEVELSKLLELRHKNPDIQYIVDDYGTMLKDYLEFERDAIRVV